MQFAEKARDFGYEWAAIELDDYGNWTRWDAFRSACVGYGLIPGYWVTEGRNIEYAPPEARFGIAECEGPGDYDGIRLAIDHGLPKIPLAIVTNFNVPLINSSGVPQPQNAAPLIEAGFACQTEAYLGDNPNATPDNLDRLARGCGWATSQPVFGVYNAPLSTYEPWMTWPGADYLAEYVL